MPYILYKSNGLKLTTIADGSVDKVSTDLTFVGKNYSGYGEIINQNLVKILENFANTSEPKTPLVGQLYYSTGDKKLKVYDGIRFKPIQNTDIGNTAPRDNSKGDLWFNDFEKKLYFYDGSKFILIGPQDSQFTGIALIPAVAVDNRSRQFNVLKFVMANSADTVSSVAALTSIDEFTPNITDELTQKGYNIVKKGITLPGANASTGKSYDIAQETGYVFWGSAAHALRLGEYRADEYVLNSYLNNLTSNGFDVGPYSYGIRINGYTRLTGSAATGTQLISYTDTIDLNAFYTPANTSTNIIRIQQNNVTPGLGVPVNLGTTNQRFNSLWATTVNSTVSYSNTYTGNLIGNVTGNVVASLVSATSIVAGGITTGILTATTFYGQVSGPISGNVYTSLLAAAGDTERSPAQIKGAWSLIGNSSLSATYADLAERYHADAVYDHGTVLVIGGVNEVTVTDVRANVAVAGVVSKNPAYMLNQEAGPDETHPYVALTGRIPCKVVGNIIKGDLLVTSTRPGYAEAFRPGDNPTAVIGKALEHFEGSEGIIEIKV